MISDDAGERAARAREACRERERFVRSILDEEDRAALYEALAALERDRRRADVYRRLAALGRSHAMYWRERLRSIGYAIPRHALSLRTRVLIKLARWPRGRFAMRSIAAPECGGDEN